MTLEHAPYTGPDPMTHLVEDGRLPLKGIFDMTNRLATDGKFARHIITRQPIRDEDGTVTDRSLPIIGYTSRIVKNEVKPALWLIGGIHGEEPAGPNTLAMSVDEIMRLEQTGVPMVVMPMMNPAAYYRDFRYNGVRRGTGNSITDADYLLADRSDTNGCVTRMPEPPFPETKDIFKWILKTARCLPPHLSIDLHEDDNFGLPDSESRNAKKPYFYSDGTDHEGREVAKRIVSILKRYRCSTQKKGTTRFGEKISNGVIYGMDDGSIDEFLSSRRVIVEGKRTHGPSAKASIVMETRVANNPLLERIVQQRILILALPELWRIVDTAA